ncbi:HET domain protein [Xylaria palmicola]|nr:HET domain protein [Xylaria palmicola]
MKLINVETLTMEEFMVVNPDTLEYAILSHTWQHEELTFQDFTGPDSQRKRMSGFGKIEKTCELARRDGIRYAWVDTCCIDKTSSAELTEAINSMYSWYRDAKVCYVWLADLPTSTEEALESSLMKCRWFTRGWTLQELLAPRHVEFYDREWQFRGTKKDLKGLIADTTQIGTEVLENPEGIYRLPIAQRMAWAARRQTTRPEDMAYCLIGIFEVNMPMIYGEGQRAFLRLQEEIVKDTNDLSIFAWKAAPGGQRYRGIFATSPAEFGGCGSVRLIDNELFSPEFSLSNKGLHIQTDQATDVGGSWLLKLNCKDGPGGQPISIWLQNHGGEVYSRSRAHEYGDPDVVGGARRLQKLNIYALKRLDAPRSANLEASHRGAFVFGKNFNTMREVRFPGFPFCASPIIETRPNWDAARCMLHTHGVDRFDGYAHFTPRQGDDAAVKQVRDAGEWFVVAFGRARDEDRPWITVHGKGDARARELILVGIRDLQRMGQVAREDLGRPPCVMLTDFRGNPLGKKVSASINEGTMDGQSVYFIDIELEDVADPMGSTEDGTST